MVLRRILMFSVLAVLFAACTSTKPGLELDVAEEVLTVFQGADGSATVNVTRIGGFEGEVTVTLEGAPAGVSAEALTIAAGETSGTLTVSATETATLGDTEVTVNGAGTGVSADDTLTLTVAEAPGTQSTYAQGFNGPMGAVVDGEGNVWVIDSGVGGETVIEPGVTYGETSRVVKISSDGTQTVAANLPSLAIEDEGFAGGSRLALLDGELYATSAEVLGPPTLTAPFFSGVVRIDEDAVVEIADTWAVEAANDPDATGEYHSHPYGLTADLDGNLWVADAGGNDLLKVAPDTGEVAIVAVFEPVPDPTGETDFLQAVPTGVTTKDGNIYVTFFHGGVAQVTPEGEVSSYAEDVILATDIQRGPDGELYIIQIADFTFGPGTGSIIRVKQDGSETILSGLTYPSSLAFDADGNAFVTTNVLGEPGSGEVVRIAGLTSLNAQ